MHHRGMRIKTDFKEKLPPASRYDFSPGQTVRVYREKNRSWEGPFKVRKIHGNQVWITEGVSHHIFSFT